MTTTKWVGLVACGVLVMAVAGCGVLDSRAKREYTTLQAQHQELLAKEAADNARITKLAEDQMKLQRELDAEKVKSAKSSTGSGGGGVTVGGTPDERIAALHGELAKLGFAVQTTRDGKFVRLSSDILFASGRATLKPEARPVLSKIASAIKKVGQDVVLYVDGHTDADPLVYTKKLYGDNNGLAAARANAVAKELIALGVPKDRVLTRSFGDDKPIGDNKSADGKKQNRRVELSFAVSKAFGGTTAAATAARTTAAPAAKSLTTPAAKTAASTAAPVGS